MYNSFFTYRNYSSLPEFTVGYRFGFNGKENDESNRQNYGLRNYLTHLGRFFAVDPLTKSFPWYSTYQFAGNKPIIAIDLEGAEEFIRTRYIDIAGNLYRTEIQVIGEVNFSDGKAFGIGATQIIHETEVRERTTGPNPIFTAQYMGTNVGNLVPPGSPTSPNAPGSSSFNLQENQAMSNFVPVGRDGNGALLFDKTTVFGAYRSILTTTVNSNGGSEVNERGEVISVNNGYLSSGVIRINWLGTPPSEPYLPTGFNVTPLALSARFSAADGSPLPIIIASSQNRNAISLDLNIFCLSHQGKSSARPTGSVMQLPDRNAAENGTGPQIRTRARTTSVTF